MKKYQFFIVILILSIGYVRLNAQPIPVYTIPSSDIDVNGYANFIENYSNSSSPDQVLEKRQVNVQIKSVTHGCQVNIWVYTLDRTTILGPYTMTGDDLLTVEIDDNEWGVLVESEDEVLVSVWIGNADSFSTRKVISLHQTGISK